MKNKDELSRWYNFLELLIANHGKIYAAGFLLGWLYRLSRTDYIIRQEFDTLLKKEESLYKNHNR